MGPTSDKKEIENTRANYELKFILKLVNLPRPILMKVQIKCILKHKRKNVFYMGKNDEFSHIFHFFRAESVRRRTFEDVLACYFHPGSETSFLAARCFLLVDVAVTCFLERKVTDKPKNVSEIAKQMNGK